MNLRLYKQRLAKHDWYYSSSDDDRIYSAGLAEEKALKSMTHGKKTYKQAYDFEFNKHFKDAKKKLPIEYKEKGKTLT